MYVCVSVCSAYSLKLVKQLQSHVTFNLGIITMGLAWHSIITKTPFISFRDH